MLKTLILMAGVFLSSNPAAQANAGYLNGQWTIKTLATNSPAKSEHFAPIQTRIHEATLALSFDIQQDIGVLEWNDLAAGCVVRVGYQVGYCCPRMKKLFLDSDFSEVRDEPQGCLNEKLHQTQDQFIESIQSLFEADYKFAFFDESKGFTLNGPYSEPTEELWFESKKD